MKKTLLALSTLAVISCSKPAEESIDMAAVRTEIEAMETAYAAAQNAKDIEGLMVYYAEDAQSMINDHPTLVGKAAIRAHMEAEFADTTMNGITLSAATSDVWAAGNLAVETGIWKATGGDGTVLREGKYMALYEKRDGKYICIRDTWNANSAPMPAAPTAEVAPAEAAM